MLLHSNATTLSANTGPHRRCQAIAGTGVSYFEEELGFKGCGGRPVVHATLRPI